MAKLKFIGNAYAPITYLGKYQVENGSTLEYVNDTDADLLLQSGHFEAIEEEAKLAKDDSKDSSKK